MAQRSAEDMFAMAGLVRERKAFRTHQGLPASKPKAAVQRDPRIIDHTDTHQHQHHQILLLQDAVNVWSFPSTSDAAWHTRSVPPRGCPEATDGVEGRRGEAKTGVVAMQNRRWQNVYGSRAEEHCPWRPD